MMFFFVLLTRCGVIQVKDASAHMADIEIVLGLLFFVSFSSQSLALDWLKTLSSVYAHPELTSPVIP